MGKKQNKKQKTNKQTKNVSNQKQNTGLQNCIMYESTFISTCIIVICIKSTYFISSHQTAYPSLRGSCPLDVAAASLMDNNELALALREAHLEKVITYLSKCGVQDNARLTGMGKHSIGWDPLDGERYLDFMRHAVWVNGRYYPFY